ncbi:hypothetical protein ACFO5T_10835, partial [Dokdonia genika]
TIALKPILKRSHTIAVITKYTTAFCEAYFIVNCEPLGNQPPRLGYGFVAESSARTFRQLPNHNLKIGIFG